jgi:hypothetical protein
VGAALAAGAGAPTAEGDLITLDLTGLNARSILPGEQFCFEPVVGPMDSFHGSPVITSNFPNAFNAGIPATSGSNSLLVRIFTTAGHITVGTAD